MKDIDLDRYFKNHRLRSELEAQARRERAQAVGKLLIAAARWLARLPARLGRTLSVASRAASRIPTKPGSSSTRACRTGPA
jgi:hypothetical protein